MKNILTFLVNSLLLLFVAVIAIAIATLAITKKVNEDKFHQSLKIKVTVIKTLIPVVAFSDGVVKKVQVTNGQQVKKDDLLVRLDNPALTERISVLDKSKNNESAQTESNVAKEQEKNFLLKAPESGVIGDIFVTEGSPIQNLAKVLNLYSNKDVKLIARATTDDYLKIKKQRLLQAYDKRLDQNFAIFTDNLNPSESSTSNNGDKKIGIYFKLKSPTDSDSLINNEDLTIDLDSQKTTYTKPIDLFINFWNGYISK